MLKQPNFFSLTSPNNKMSDTTSKKKHKQKKTKKGTYIHRNTGRDTATASANYCWPKTLIAKKN